MSFKEVFERYRNNTATDEERAMVDEEIEKYRIITEYLDEGWDIPAAPIDEEPIKEMQKVRKNMRKRSILIVLTSIVLCMAIFLTSWLVIIPTIEKQYPDPTANTIGSEYSNDLETMLAVYGELFDYDTNIASVTSTKTGYATYDLTIQHYNRNSKNSYSAKATLKKNKLLLSNGLLNQVPINIFTRASYPFYDDDLLLPRSGYFTHLPENTTITAAVSFKKDLDMTELVLFNRRLTDGSVSWVGVRNSPLNVQLLPLCGFNLSLSGAVLDKTNDTYPDLYLPYGKATVAYDLENHFTDMLTFLNDQYDNGIRINAPGTEGDTCYYKEVLDYIEANGIYSYGCYVTGTPETFLELLDNEMIEQIIVLD